MVPLNGTIPQCAKLLGRGIEAVSFFIYYDGSPLKGVDSFQNLNKR